MKFLTLKGFYVLALAASLFFTSCGVSYKVGYRSDIYNFIGRSYAEIVEELGAPTREYDEADGFVLVYAGSPEVFSYAHYDTKAYGLPVAKFLMGNDEICHDITLYNTEHKRSINTGGLIALILLFWARSTITDGR